LIITTHSLKIIPNLLGFFGLTKFPEGLMKKVVDNILIIIERRFLKLKSGTRKFGKQIP